MVSVTTFLSFLQKKLYLTPFSQAINEASSASLEASADSFRRFLVWIVGRLGLGLGVVPPRQN